jgi:hypothetical protein
MPVKYLRTFSSSISAIGGSLAAGTTSRIDIIGQMRWMLVVHQTKGKTGFLLVNGIHCGFAVLTVSAGPVTKV